MSWSAWTPAAGTSRATSNGWCARRGRRRALHLRLVRVGRGPQGNRQATHYRERRAAHPDGAARRPNPTRLGAFDGALILEPRAVSGNRGVESNQEAGRLDADSQVTATPARWKSSIRTVKEELRIIHDDLWKRVASRRADTEGKPLRFAGTPFWPTAETEMRNLLARLATCGLCGGGLVVETSGHKAGRVPQYVCTRFRRQGTARTAARRRRRRERGRHAGHRGTRADPRGRRAGSSPCPSATNPATGRRPLEREAADIDKRIRVW